MLINAVRDDVPHERIVATGTLAHRDHSVLQQCCQDLLNVHSALKDDASQRSCGPGFAKCASVQDANDGFAGERQKEAVAVRDNRVEAPVIGEHRQQVPEVAHGDPPAQPRVDKIFPRKGTDVVDGPSAVVNRA